MIQKSTGIIINSLKYSDNSLIIKVLDDEDQVLSLFVRSRKKYPSIQIPLLQIEVIYYSEENKGLFTVKDISVSKPFISIPIDPFKGAQVFFIQEILSMVTREPGYSPGLFSFTSMLIEEMDKGEPRPDHHLRFLAGLTSFLGFFPGNVDLNEPVAFDLQEGLFFDTTRPILSQSIVPQETCRLLQAYFKGNSLPSPKGLRNQVLNELIKYYLIHYEGFREPKSIEVLRLLFQ